LYMSPAPGISHQKAVLRLASYLLALVENAGLGQTFVSPIDVELSPGTVFEPDIVVVLNAGRDKVTASHIVGAPALVVEVLSPGTQRYDRTTKREAYALAGIKEYWLVDPIAHTIETLFLLEGKAYRSVGVFSGQDRLVSKVVPTITDVSVEQCFVNSLYDVVESTLEEGLNDNKYGETDGNNSRRLDTRTETGALDLC